MMGNVCGWKTQMFILGVIWIGKFDNKRYKWVG